MRSLHPELLFLLLVDSVTIGSCRSICDFANKINDEEWPLDVLINNAGTFLQRHRTTEEGFELTGGVNYFGPFLLTHLLLNKLKDSKPSRYSLLCTVMRRSALTEHISISIRSMCC